MAHEVHIIIDRKKKRFYHGMDDQWRDPLGIEAAQQAKAHTLEIDKASDNMVDKFIVAHSQKELIGRKVWAFKKESERVIIGYVVDVYPARVLLVKENDKNVPVTFDSVFSIGDA